MEFLPADYQDVTDAWDRLGYYWQSYVRAVKMDYMDEIGPW